MGVCATSHPATSLVSHSPGRAAPTQRDQKRALLRTGT